MNHWSAAARVGFFTVIVVAAGLLILRFVGPKTSTSNGYTVYAELRDATGLAPQSRVTMAGIAVGAIQSIRLDTRGMARVDIRLGRDVELREDAAVARRMTSMLGEYFLALTPGTEGRPTLGDGARIAHVIEPASTDQILVDVGRIADRVKLVSENLATVFGSTDAQQQMRDTLAHLAEVTEALNETVRENRETIRRTLIDVEGIAGRSGPQIQQILENVRVITSDVRSLLAENQAERLADGKGGTNEQTKDKGGPSESAPGKSTMGKVRETVERVERASENLESALAHANSVAARIDKGEGTVGRLTKDEALVDEIQGVAEGANDFIGGVSRLQTIVGLRADYNFVANTIKNYVELRLQPAEDKYYLIEVVNDPRGRTTFEQIDVDTTDPTRPSHYRDVRTVTSNAFRFSLMFAKRINLFTGRFGIKESTGGLGLDTHLLQDRFEILQDLFGFGEELQPRWRVALSYEFVKHLWMLAGIDDILSRDRRDYLVGLQLRFNDQDLKSMLPFAPKF